MDAKISLERERILEQKALIKKVNANPWFIYDQGITCLKWPTGAYVVSEYGDGRVKTTSWPAIPAKLKQSCPWPRDMDLSPVLRLFRLLLPQGA